MSFRFKRNETVTKAARRLCRERLDQAMEMLETGAVHDARKQIKKLRAILRLVRSGIGRTAYEEATGDLREAAGRLNPMRDAQARLTALGKLAKRSKGQFPRSILPKLQNSLRQSCKTEENKWGETVNSVKRYLFAARQQLGSLKVKPNSWKTLGPGLKKIYGRGRKALALAEREPSPEHFHDWRKRVKDLANQLQLLCAARSGKIKPCMADLKHLGHLLGDDHDLFMLNEFIEQNLKRLLARVIAVRQKKLRSKALQAGASFYGQKPRQFCRRVGTGWKK
ncbi:MAG: CHAD domain-containing protein [Limisphaerales bacterium]